MIATIIYFAQGNIPVLVKGPEKGAAETTIINFVQWLKLLVAGAGKIPPSEIGNLQYELAGP